MRVVAMDATLLQAALFNELLNSLFCAHYMMVIAAITMYCKFLNCVWVFVDVTGWWCCGRCTAARGSVSGSRGHPVCTVVSHSVPSDANCTGKTTGFSWHWTNCFSVTAYDSFISFFSFLQTFNMPFSPMTHMQFVNVSLFQGPGFR